MIDLTAAKVLARAGLLKPARPDQLLKMGVAVARYGVSPAAGYGAYAARTPNRPAIIDDEGVLSFREVDERTARIAGELRARGVQEGDSVGLLARNGRGWIEGTVALAKVGADVLFLNTSGAGEQIAEVLDREKATAVIHDEEFRDLTDLAGNDRISITTEELSQLAGTEGPGAPLRVGRTPKQVILTSGTTGAPRGAARSGGKVDDIVSMLSRIPLKTEGTTVIPAPLFHAWGLGHWGMAMALGSTVVVTRKFDPKKVLELVTEHKGDALVVVPVMLERLLETYDEDPDRYDVSQLKIVASSGSALPGDLAKRTLSTWGPVLYNLYGSTEVAYAAVADPDDLRKDPRTAGKAPHGVTLKIYDEDGKECPPGTPGRIFVGSGAAFGGYTDGSDKDRIGDLISTGDMGCLDEEGRLTVLGRDDDMVVVGGENIYPGSVEDVLREHDAVADVAVVDEPDEKYGAKLVAHVVPAKGKSLDEKALQELVRKRIARFAVPRKFVTHDELPRNGAGKVVKRQLKESGGEEKPRAKKGAKKG